MSEKESRKCAYCHQEKPWIWTQGRLKDGSKIYIDNSKRRWAGRRCPDCERSRVQAAVRCDSFEKEIIMRQLEEQGYQIHSKTLPITVQANDSTNILTVGIRRAFTRNGQIVVESSCDEKADIYALVFESVRICSAEQMEQLSPRLEVYALGNKQAVTEGRSSQKEAYI
ncbi:MAG: hypothetical protein R3B45_17190 [Bdellovibrionota bacterium]